MARIRLPLALLLATASACTPAEPFPVPLQLTPQRLELEEARYNEPPPFASYELRNVSGSLMFVTPASPTGDRPDLLNIGFAPYTELLPGQRILVEVAMEERTWRWSTGTYEAGLLLEGSYFFSGQELDEPEVPSTNSAPNRQAQIYELSVGFSINCDLDEDGYDAVECAGPDCDDRDPEINPEGIESCNGIDEDCDGAVDEYAIDRESWWLDEDEDGFGDPAEETLSCDRPSNDHIDNGDDCDDSQLIVRPGAQEECDGQDNDCDGEIDEDPGCQ
jgi:hypothetical protein